MFLIFFVKQLFYTFLLISGCYANQILKPRKHLINLEITSKVNRFDKRIISINGHNDTYGPVIRVRSGDILNLAVKNLICSESDLSKAEHDDVLRDYCTTSIHFHGLIGIGNNNDGIPLLTQAPIIPGETYFYNFTIPKDVCGTYWYHSHTSVQYGDGLRGAFIIDCSSNDQLVNSVIEHLSTIDEAGLKPSSLLDVTNNYDGVLYEHNSETQEEIITLSDSYDKWGLDILRDDVLSRNGDPDPSLTGSLINGNSEDDSFVILRKNTKYLRLRIINTGMSGTQVINIENHQMVVIETDGVLIKPFVLSTLSLAIGQRYTVVIKLTDKKQPIKLINGCNKMMGYFSKVLWFIENDNDRLNILHDNQYSAGIKINSLPNLDKRELYRDLIPFVDKDDSIKNQITSGFLDQVSDSIALDYQYFSDENTKDKYGTGMYKFNHKTFREYAKEPIDLTSNGQTIEIIINSIDHMRHPWHLHGHRFQLVSIGNGREGSLNTEIKDGSAWNKYQDDLDYWKSTGLTPTVRDSINIPGSSFAVIRFKLDDPGIWLLHCHIEWHMSKGLGVVFRETANKSDIPEPDGSKPISDDETDIPINQKLGGDISKQQQGSNKGKVLIIYLIIMLLLNGILYLFTI